MGLTGGVGTLGGGVTASVSKEWQVSGGFRSVFYRMNHMKEMGVT